MSHAINLELGPNVLGYPDQVAGEKVCILTPTVAEDREIQARVRRFMRGQGRDCRICRGCPAGTAE